jgi:hypothetical protein
MRSGVRRAIRWVLPAAAWMLLGSAALAQESVMVICGGQGPCTYQRVYSVTWQGKESLKLVAPAGASDARAVRKARSGRVDTVLGLYRDPQSGLVRVVTHGWQLGDVAIPSKLPEGTSTASAAVANTAFEYLSQPRSKTPSSVPVDQLVVLLKGPGVEGAVVGFLRHELQAGEPHPQRADIVAGGLAFAAASAELRAWREALRNTMRRSLEVFTAGGVDPTRFEATLDEGLEAMRVYRLVALKGEEEIALQDQLTAKHDRLLEQFAIAGALKHARMHDAYLQKLDQIGLARWSRPDLVAGVDESLRASKEQHLQRATDLLADKQFGRAFDEAQLAYGMAPCDEKTSRFYDMARVQFVNRNMKPVSPEYDKEHRNVLEQIVREIQGVGSDAGLTPERIEYVRKRIRDGEDLDKDYLPLQLKKADFLAALNEYMAARDVVIRVERTVQLGPDMKEQWLQLDARLTRDLSASLQRFEKQAWDLMQGEQFKAGASMAAMGLKADPGNRRLLYLSAVAAAVTRDQTAAKKFAEDYLRPVVLDCGDARQVEKTLLELYRRPDLTAAGARADDSAPNWVSGERYAPGEVFYDPLSGSFQPHVSVASVVKGPRLTNTEFRWDGFMVQSITTSLVARQGEAALGLRTLLALEPVYDQNHLYMSGIGQKANSAGERRISPLRYLNCPDFDPLLAAKFTGRVSTRGWAGNPFFHPFLWDGIFLFDLTYDDLGRIKTATPVVQDVSRPSSPYSEPLTFVWEGDTKRLLAIKGAKYLREMVYDDRGRLVEEKIRHPEGNGKIEYRYRGDSMQMTGISCEDEFYDKAARTISLALDARDR